MARWIAALSLLVAAISPSPARAGSFADPGARFFTLVPRGPVFAVATLPDGGVVYSTRKALVALSTDGSRRRVRIGEDARTLAAEPDGSVITTRDPSFAPDKPGMIERVDLLTGRETKVAEFRARRFGNYERIEYVTVLDDGSIIVVSGDREVSGASSFWLVGSAGEVRRLPLRGDRDVVSLAPLPGGGFAFTEMDGRVFAATLSGAVHQLAVNVVTPITASGDGGVLAGVSDRPPDAPGRSRRVIARIGPDGSITPLTGPVGGDRVGLGTGDGLPLSQVAVLPFDDSEGGSNQLALAGDGSLVFAPARGLFTAGRLGALVPPDSPRPRIALSQTSFNSVDQGHVGFVAGAPGAVHVEARSGGKLVATGDGSAAGAGEGDVQLPASLRPAVYKLDLRLTTSAASVESGPVLIDTRPTLPLRDARRALRRRYAWSDGDEGGEEGVSLGRCHRRTALVIACSLRWGFHTNPLIGDPPGSWGESRAPAGSATATLLRDGIHTQSTYVLSDDAMTLWRYSARLSGAARQPAGRLGHIALRVRSRRPAQARLIVKVRWSADGRHLTHRTLSLRHRFRRRVVWRPIVVLPPGAVAAARAGRKSLATIRLRAKFRNPHGSDTEQHGLRVRLTP